ncbi:MAG TPA: glutaredoxin [Actinomycetota bacterium]
MVTAPGCHLCADAREALATLARQFPLEVREVGASSPEGLTLVAKHRPALQPLVLVDEVFFSAGRLPRRKLRRRLERRVA